MRQYKEVAFGPLPPRRAILLPVYEDHEELNARVLIPFDGAIHCITATIPTAPPQERR